MDKYPRFGHAHPFDFVDGDWHESTLRPDPDECAYQRPMRGRDIAKLFVRIAVTQQHLRIKRMMFAYKDQQRFPLVLAAVHRRQHADQRIQSAALSGDFMHTEANISHRWQKRGICAITD